MRILEAVVNVLQPFKLATEALSGEKTPTLSQVTPIYIKLNRILERDEDDAPMIASYKNSMRDNLAKRKDETG